MCVLREVWSCAEAEGVLALQEAVVLREGVPAGGLVQPQVGVPGCRWRAPWMKGLGVIALLGFGVTLIPTPTNPKPAVGVPG